MGEPPRDGDSDKDVAVIDNEPDPSDVTVLRSRGDGSFRDPHHYKAGNSPIELVVGDFDGDGKLDLAASELGARAVIR